MTDDATTTDPTVAEPTATTATTAPELASGAPQAESPATEVTTTIPATGATDGSRARRVALVAGLGRLGRFLVMVALFATGVGLGYARFQVTQPAAATTGGADIATVAPPASVQAMIQSLSVNDMDSLRSSVAAIRDAQGAVVVDPYRQLVGELQGIGMLEVNKVEVLSTFVDGPRTATAIIMSGHGQQGIAISRHLIVQTISGQIVYFK